jgi:M6 family metalloprotease-like protein
MRIVAANLRKLRWFRPIIAAVLLLATTAGQMQPARSANSLTPVTGARPWLIVLCRATDVTYKQTLQNIDPVAWYTGLLSDQAPGFGAYWREASYGLLNIDGSQVKGVYSMSKPASAYFEQRNGTYFLLDAGVTECLDAASSDVNIPSFAGIFVVFPTPIDANGVDVYGGRVASEGGFLELTYGGQTKLYGFARITNSMPSHSYIGHEWGHAFGLMHSGGMYNNEYDSAWDVVSGGGKFAPRCDTLNPALRVYGCPSAHPIAYNKSLLGWLPDERVLTMRRGTTRTITLSQLATTPSDTSSYLMVKIPFYLYGTYGNGFYTLEARKQVGFDQIVPGSAVVMHKVDDYFNYYHGSAQVVDVDNNSNPNDDGAQWKPGETFVSIADGVSVVMCVNAETATGYSVTIGLDADTCGVKISRQFMPLAQQ